jgi:hypothetical protein
MFVVPVNYPFNEFWDKPLPLLLNVAHYPPLHVFCFIPIFSGLLDGFVAQPHHVGLIVLTFRESGSKARIMRKITENLPKTMFVQRIFCGLLVSVPESKKKKKNKIQTSIYYILYTIYPAEKKVEIWAWVKTLEAPGFKRPFLNWSVTPPFR